MNFRKLIATVFFALVTCMSGGAMASVIYDSGADDSVNANFINNGFSVTGALVLSSAYTGTAFNFSGWTNSGDALQSADWAISSSPFGTALYSGTGAATTVQSQFTNRYSFNQSIYQISLGNISLGAGNYYMQLNNAVTANRSDAYWGNSSIIGLNGYQTNAMAPWNGAPVTLITFNSTPETNTSFQLLGAGAGGVAPEMNASLIPQVGLLLACLFFLFGRKKEVVEPMLTA